ncbi:MAG: hypothetical protein N7Q72_00720, partial [Spiroplasma sp. Tabriz.8]|nr:hypothetical protein [Candidatus Karelsulcia muelleri]MCZ8631765.1 hypothetical protein [Spiroplasma sp. Tabriz.8]
VYNTAYSYYRVIIILFIIYIYIYIYIYFIIILSNSSNVITFKCHVNNKLGTNYKNSDYLA